MVRLVLLTLVLGLAISPAHAQGALVLARPVAPADSAAADEVLARAREWHDALLRADTLALGDILAPEFALTVPPHIEWAHTPRVAYLANVPHYHLHADRWEASEVRVLGDVAVVTSRYVQEATVYGEDRSGLFVLTDLWRRASGVWRVSARWSTWLDEPR